ncbi:hypothetical protein CLU79DRAFT_839211 [Phycomyces nitens]|nr:hypothetical protein CLU79DRAFT_839211 [Phycomyces nitens]
MSWMTIVHLVIYNLMRRQSIEATKIKDRDHKFFRWKEDVCAFIEDHWHYLAPDKQRSLTWHNTIASVLSTHSNIFQSGFEKFHQSAWWTLKKEEPPGQETKSKVVKMKPNLKKPLKRARDTENEEASTDRILRRRTSSIAQPTGPNPIENSKSTVPKPQCANELSVIKEEYKEPPALDSKEDEEDIFDLSSLSEISSDSDLFSEVNEKDQSRPLRTSIQDKGKATERWVQQIKQEVEEPIYTPEESFAPETEIIKPKEKRQSISTPKAIPSPKPLPSQDQSRKNPIERKVVENNQIQKYFLPSNNNIKVDSNQEAIKNPTPKPALDTDQSPSSELPVNSQLIDIQHTFSSQTKEDKHDHKKDAEGNQTPRIPPTPAVLSQHEEWLLFQRLENAARNLPPNAARYCRKLGVRRLKRNLGLKIFDIDNHVAQHIRQKLELEPMSKDSHIKPATNQLTCQNPDSLPLSTSSLESLTSTPYMSSFASRLYGQPRQHATLTRDEPWLSLWNGRKLRPYIRRDFESKPARMQMLWQIKTCSGRPKPRQEQKINQVEENASIDYVYFQRQHLEQANVMLSRCFWEGIDVSESLLFPEFSVIALYKRCVIGCAFMTPEAYITYIAVLPGWENAGIGQFMLYHLFQTAISKDITLHVSANNNAMILYQKFGFKPEEFIVNFYDKYLPSDSVLSKNAFLLRLRR